MDKISLTKLNNKHIYSNLFYVDNEKKVVINFTPRAGCSSVFINFLRNLNLLNEAFQYNSWIHEFRTKKINTNCKVIDINFLKKNNYKFIKFIINPYQRAVSIWRVQNSKNTSFIEWLRDLDKGDIKYLNNNDKYHYHTQYINGEEKYIDKYININKNEVLTINNFEINLNKNIDKIKNHHCKKSDIKKFCGNVKKEEFIMPSSYKYMYNDEAKKLVEKIYKDDIQKYGYKFEDLN